MKSPVGELLLMATDKKLLAVLWERDEVSEGSLARFKKSQRHPVIQETKKQLKEYFSGKRMKFDLPLDFRGTDFQKKVWKELTKVPFGKTKSYSAQAEKVGDVKKVRAVAGANGMNPISIVAPCHRIIGKNGSLTGFAAGIDKKQWLLDHEQTVLSQN